MFDRRRKSLVQVGCISVELVDEGVGEGLRFALVERGRGVRREIRVTEIELLWLCLIFEDASSRYDKEFSRSYGGFVRRLHVDRLVFEREFQLRLRVKDGGRVWFAMLLELSGNGGWVDISRNFLAFCVWKRADGLIDDRSYKDVANIGGWPVNTVVVEMEGRRRRVCDVEVRAESSESNMRFLGRCLVGRLEDRSMALPEAMEVQRWAQKMWKVSAGVHVQELGGASFLFTLPSAEEALRVLRGRWSLGGRRLDLERWSPFGCCVKQGSGISEVWVRILGLPLHLWDFAVFKEIGEFCGGFLRVDEETSMRLHLRWARIAVRAVPELIPRSVKVAVGGWTYELPLWVENGPTVVFNHSLELEKGGDGGPHGVTVGEGIGKGAREMTRGSDVFQASGSSNRSSYGLRSFSKFESRHGFESGPRREASRRVSRLGLPVKTSLVELKNRKWVKKGDPGGGPSFGGSSSIRSGREMLKENQIFRALSRSDKEGRTDDDGCRSQTLVDSSEVCIFTDRSSPSFSSAFSFLEEGESGAVQRGCPLLSDSNLSWDSETVNIIQAGEKASMEKVVEDNCAGVRVSSVNVSGQSSMSVEEKEVGGELSVWSCQTEEELFHQLGWVQELVDGGLVGNDSESFPVEIRELEGTWNDIDLLSIGMSHAEVSKWVLKRINGFSKFLGVSLDGFEDRAMKLFADIEEKWRNEVGQNVNRGGSKASKGARELKSWNVSGLNARDKMVVVKTLLREWKADVACLQETKLRNVSREVVRELCGSRWVDWILLDATGAAGGVLVLWDSRVVERIDVEVGMFSVSCLFKNVEDGFRWVFTGVYGPVIHRLREDMWEELSAVAFRWDAPWCVGGDFNVVRFPHERWVCNSISRKMRRFSDLIGELELIDPPLSGSNFTWFGAQDIRNVEEFGHLKYQKANVVDVIRRWDLEEQLRELREEEKVLRDNAKEEFGKIAKLEEIRN
ncbi:hypothetical protein RHGRI_020999 [Rhododendron griersonianum]|uniref:DUF4283 domain-containing protein n=1 Tax=Rhododendron griersonianum TaxID=479676 RepID=A0AAV6JIG8_9ERIC|nr:hypothetical protein RHGRI_020999 [Rhododendron griersonianum]